VKSSRSLLAALVLSVWVLALGHVALEHCAAMSGGCAVACAPSAGHDHHDEHGSDGHHHFTPLASSPFAKVVDVKLPVAWMAGAPSLGERLLEALRASAEPRGLAGSWESPPDERTTGWLLVCRTARPVRGPSLEA
jgi:hypothetical protein